LLPGVLTLTTQTMRGGKSLLNLYPLLGAPSLRQDVWHVKVITCLVGSDVVTEHKVKLKARVGNLFQKHSFVVFVEILFMSRQRSINRMFWQKIIGCSICGLPVGTPCPPLPAALRGSSLPGTGPFKAGHSAEASQLLLCLWGGLWSKPSSKVWDFFCLKLSNCRL
jgi:hypothetical protein